MQTEPRIMGEWKQKHKTKRKISKGKQISLGYREAPGKQGVKLRWKKIVFSGNKSVPVLRAPRGILMAQENM